MVRLGSPVQHLLPSDFAAIVVLVAHSVGADVQCQADGLCGLLHVTAALDNVLGCDFEGRRAVLLLKAAREVTLVIVLPLEHARYLVHEAACLDPLPCLVHGALVGALEGRIRIVVEEAASRVARLVAALAADNV